MSPLNTTQSPGSMWTGTTWEVEIEYNSYHVYIHIVVLCKSIVMSVATVMYGQSKLVT